MNNFCNWLQIRHLIAFLLSLALPVEAQYTYVTTNGTVSITGYTGSGGAVTIPATLDGLPVTSITKLSPQGPLQGLATLTSVTVPNSVVSIGNSVFAACPGLTNVTFGSGLTNLGGGQFEFDGALLAINVASNNPAFSSVAGVLFNQRQTILLQYPGGVTAGSYTVPASVTTLGGASFEGTRLTNITLPAGLTNLGSLTFYNASNLVSLAIPKSLIGIDASDFMGCTNLRAITVASGNPAFTGVAGVLFNKNQTVLRQYPPGLTGGYVVPGSVTNIGDSAFNECAGLSRVTLPGGLKTLGNNAFAGCSSLTNIVIPAGVTSISIGAFAQCSDLTHVTLGGGVTNLGISAFAFCTKLSSITLPPGLTSIGDNAFQNCQTLAPATIPDAVTSIGRSAFSGARVWNLTLGNGVTNIGDYAFSQSGVTNIVFGDSLISLGDQAFANCYGLYTVTLPAGLVSIGDLAFQNDYISTVNLPASVTQVGAAPFCGSASVVGITVDPANSAYASVNGVLYNRSLTSLIEFTDSAGGSYAVPAGVTNIAADAFYYCPNLASVTLPEGLLDIGTNALGECWGLTSVIIPDSVREIESGAFNGDRGLTSVAVGSGLVSVGDAAFSSCSSLPAITLPAGLTNLSENAFASCYDLTSAVLPAGLTHLGAGAFSSCQSLTDVVLPPGLTSLSNQVFYGCESLPSITLPGGVTSIGNEAFEECNSLTNIVLPAGVTSIGTSAFSECPLLTSITLPAGLTSLGDAAFEFSGLTNIVIPDSITYLPTAAFNQCPALASVTIAGSVTGLGAQAFLNCSSLASINFLGNAPTADPSVFLNDYGATVYYEPGTTGWSATFDGLPALPADSVASGALTVTIDPAFLLYDGANWQVDGGIVRFSGGTVSNLAVGAHTISFTSTEGFITPPSLTVQVQAGVSTNLTVTYAPIPVPGSLQVTITPTAAVNAGAEWRVNGGAYQASGATIANLPDTNVVVTFKAIPGWTAPASQTVGIPNGQITNITAAYADVTKPTVGGLNVASGQRVSNSVFTVTGKAGDNLGVAAVWYQLNNGAWTPATTTNAWTNWSASLPLVPGTNTLRTCAADASGRGNIYVADSGNSAVREILPGDLVNLVAGSPTGTNGFADGPAATALFNQTTGVAVDSAGNVYVADTENNLIRKVTPAGWVSTLAGDTNDLINGIDNAGYADGPGGYAQFNTPTSLAVDATGNVYVADAYNNAIRKITPAGIVSTLAGSTNAGYADGPASTALFNNPFGIVLDGAGNLVVTDGGNDLIRKITPAGQVITLAGDTYDITNQPYHINNGAGYADGIGGAARFYFPSGVAVDLFGNIYVADTLNHQVREVSPAGVVTTLAAGVFAAPSGVAVDTAGNVYVANNIDGLVEEDAPDGVVSTLALENNPGNINGTGGAASFNEPVGLVADETGANFSATNTITFDCVPSLVLQLQTVGVGTISPNYSNALLTIGDHYAVTAAAKPGSGFVFTNWVVSNPDAPEFITNGATLKFTMASNLTLTAVFTDVQKPTDVITVPAGGLQVSNSTFTVTGKAADNGGVAGVWYQYNGSAWTFASTTNNWTNWFANLTLLPGTNILRSYAVDTRNLQTVYVADSVNNAIREISPAGQVTTLAGNIASGFASGPGGVAEFYKPSATAMDSVGNLYVADSGNNLIRKISPTGVAGVFAGITNGLGGNPSYAGGYADGPGATAQFNNPSGIAVDASNNVFVADTYNNLIRKITPDGFVTTFAGDVYDLTNDPYYAFNLGFADGPGLAAQFYFPTALAFDTAGNLQVADSGNNVIRQISPAGLVTTFAGNTNNLAGDQLPAPGYADGTVNQAQFNQPSGITVDAAGNVYVGDSGNSLIRKISGGQVSTVAGDSADLIKYGFDTPNYGFADGPGDAAQFWFPEGLAADVLGNVYVADYDNNLIRKITPDGYVSTYAGNTNLLAPNYLDGPADVAEFDSPASVGLNSGNGGGNHSPTNSVTIVYVPSAPLTLQISGEGTVSPDYDGALLQIGKTYSMTAKASQGFAFTNWSQLNIFTSYETTLNEQGQPVTITNSSVISQVNGALTNRPTLTFAMTSPTVLLQSSAETITTQIGYQANFVDVAPPTLRITSPTPNQMVTNDTFLISGTASDNAAVASVSYQVNGGGWLAATGANHWTAAVTLTPGTNTLQAYAVDTSGNVSATNKVNFVYLSKAVLLIVGINGNGTITPNYNGVPLQIGQNYTMTARPAPGFAFSSWSGPMPGPGYFERGTAIRPKYTIVVLSGFPGGGGLNDNPIYFTQYLTNQPTLVFRMQANWYYFANFADIAPPTLSITAPSPHQRVSNDVYTVTGTAKDNVAVAGVYYQLNGTGWQSASTGNGWTNWFTPSLDLVPGANTIQAYAVDSSTNMSAVTTVSFDNLYEDLAPASLAGTLANVVPGDGMRYSVGFGTNTFNKLPSGSGQIASVGTYEYTKASASAAQLVYANTAPPSAVSTPTTVDLTFSSPVACTYSNEDSGEVGTMTLLHTLNIIPNSLAGKTALFINTSGIESTTIFGRDSLTLSNTSGLFETEAYGFQAYGPDGGLIAVGDASEGTNYVVITSFYTNWGAYYSSDYDAGGNPQNTDSGEFVFPSALSAAPASIAFMNANVYYADGTQGQLGFGADTFSLTAFGFSHNSNVGTYGYARQDATNVLLTFKVTTPPGSDQPLLLNFVAPDFCLFTDPGDPTNSVSAAAFVPAAVDAPASLGKSTLYATNYSEANYGWVQDVFTCNGNGTFTQVETGGANPGSSAGTFTYATYGVDVALLKLKYTSPAGMVGATNYLQATFSATDSGSINATYYDNSGDSPVTSFGDFSVH